MRTIFFIEDNKRRAIAHGVSAISKLAYMSYRSKKVLISDNPVVTDLRGLFLSFGIILNSLWKLLVLKNSAHDKIYLPFSITKVGLWKILFFISVFKIKCREGQVILHLHRSDFSKYLDSSRLLIWAIFRNRPKIIFLSAKHKLEFQHYCEQHGFGRGCKFFVLRNPHIINPSFDKIVFKA